MPWALTGSFEHSNRELLALYICRNMTVFVIHKGSQGRAKYKSIHKSKYKSKYKSNNQGTNQINQIINQINQNTNQNNQNKNQNIQNAYNINQIYTNIGGGRLRRPAPPMLVCMGCMLYAFVFVLILF